MAPLIIFNENDHFFLTVGSPGGKAIISYIAKVLLDVLYLDLEPMSSIRSPNFIRVQGKTFVENEELNKNLIESQIALNFSMSEVKTLIINSFKSSFLKEEKKKQWIEKF